MISVSTLSCYSTLSSRIPDYYYLITFFVLHFNYPALQPINTYHSLIGAVFLYRHCVWFQSTSSRCLLIVWLILMCQTVRTLIFILCRLLVSLSIEKLYTTPVCFRFWFCLALLCLSAILIPGLDLTITSNYSLALRFCIVRMTWLLTSARINVYDSAWSCSASGSSHHTLQNHYKLPYTKSAQKKDQRSDGLTEGQTGVYIH